MKRPSAEIGHGLAGLLSPSPCVPPVLTLTSVVVPSVRSRTNTSRKPFVSPATRLVASLENTTKRPSWEIRESLLSALPSAPPEPTLTRVTDCAWARATKSRTRTNAGPSKRRAFERASIDADSIVRFLYGRVRELLQC